MAPKSAFMFISEDKKQTLEPCQLYTAQKQMLGDCKVAASWRSRSDLTRMLV
jgi:hypothetical protein